MKNNYTIKCLVKYSFVVMMLTIGTTVLAQPCTLAPTSNAGTDAGICANGFYTLGGSIGGSATSATWSTSGTGTFSPDSQFGTATTYTPSAADISAGSITITLTTDDPDGAGDCLPASSSLTLTINALPTASVSGTSILCTGTTNTLTAAASAGSGTISTYQWVLNGSTNVGTNLDTYGATVAGSYTVRVTNSNGCSITSAPFVVTASGPLSGIYTIGAGPASCTNYVSFASAVSDLNTKGLSAHVTFQVAAGYTETVPAGGLILKQCGLAAALKSGPARTITFAKTGAGLNPVLMAFTPGTGTFDGVVKIVGTDNVTFDGIDVTENVLNTNATQQMEMGYGVFKCDLTDGAVGVTITNCNVALNKANTSSIAFRVANVSETNATLTGTLGSDSASLWAARNRVNITNNIISNVYAAALLNGNGASGPANDSANIITGNNISNFGGGTSTLTVINPTDNRYFVVGNNVINGGTGTNAAMTGINGGSGPFGTISGNTITLSSTSNLSNAVIGITYGASGTNNNGSITNNIIQNCSFTAATSLSFTGITSGLSGATSTITMTGNSVLNNSVAGTGAFTGIANTSNPTTLTMNNNTVSGNSLTNVSTTTHTFLGISNSSTPTNLFMNNNIVTNNTHLGVGTLTGITSSASAVNLQMNTNTITGNILTGGGAACTLTGAIISTSIYTFNNNTIYNNGVSTMTGTSAATVTGFSDAVSPTGETITGNSVRKLFVGGSSSGAHVIRGILNNTTASSVRIVSGNLIDSLYSNIGSSATITGIISSLGGTTSIFNNKMFNFYPGQNSTVASAAKGISITSGTTTHVYNNLIGIDLTPSTPVLVGSNSIIGIEITNSTSTQVVNLYYNTIQLVGNGSGTLFGTSGISITSTTPPIVDIRNNIVNNLTGAGGSAAANSAIALRRAVTSLTNYAATSNNNIYHAGTPSASHLIYYDGTNSYQTLSALQAASGVSPRETLSKTEIVNFQSTSGTNANFLKVNPLIATNVEGGALPITSPAITTDYFGTTRNSISPDIGAHEDNFLNQNTVISSVTAVPAAGQCTAVAHHIIAVVSAGSLPLTSVTLSYAYNGVPGAGSPVTLTNTSGNNWEGDIPAATPVNASVTWSVSATDASGTMTRTGASYKDAYLTGIVLNATATPNPICAGNTITLNGNIPATSFSEPFESSSFPLTTFTVSGSSATAVQNTTYFQQGSSSLLFNTTAISATVLLTGNVSMNLTDFTSATLTFAHQAIMEGGSSSFDFGYVEYSIDGGANWILFPASSYAGSGTLLGTGGGIGFSTRSYGDWSTAYTSTTSLPNNNLWKLETINIPLSAFSSSQFRIRFRYTTDSSNNYYGWLIDNIKIVASRSYTSYVWSSTAGFSSNALNTTDNPVASTVYTLTATDANGCTNSSAPINVVVNPLPPAPSGNNSVQCGLATPGVMTTSGSGIFRWYLVPAGGTPLAGQSGATLSNYPINVTTDFYVSEFDGSCEGPRTHLVATVNQPDSVVASASVSTICPFTNFNLNAMQIGVTNTYVYSWTALPVAGSGIPTSVGGNPATVQATAGGVYTYKVTATDNTLGCITTSTVNVTITNPPVITSATASSPTICAGKNDTLKALTPTFVTGNAAIGTATTLTGATAQPTAFCNRFEQYWCQLVYTAAELQAAGLNAGPINSITFNITTLGDANNVFNFRVALGPVATNTLTGFTTTGLTQVYGPATYFHQIGLNTITFSSPYIWDGISNILVDLKQGGVDLTNNAQTYFTATTGNTVAYAISSLTPPPDFTTTNPTATLSTSRLNIIFNGTIVGLGAGNYSWQWSPGTLPAGNVAIVNPTTTTTYTVQATDPNTGCSNFANVTINVNPLPPTPTAHDSVQCGPGVPTCYVVGSGGIHRWYTDPAGLNLIAGETGATLSTYAISTTTTFYVSEYNGQCEGSRVAVTQIVNNPDPLTASASSPRCLNEPITLNVMQTGSSNVYVYSWSANPTTGSGLTSPVNGSQISITPTVSGTYIYSVTGFDAATLCTAISQVSVTVGPHPSITNATAAPNPVCAGSTVTLTGVTGTTTNFLKTFGTGTTLNGTTAFPAPYTNYYGGTKHQMLIRASELTAAGITAGDITSIAFDLSAVGTTYPGSLTAFQINMIATATNALNSSSFEPGLTAPASLVYGPVTQTIPTTGLPVFVTHTLTTPFSWNGTSNIVIQTSYSNGNFGTTGEFAQQKSTDPGFVSTAYYRVDSQTPAAVLAAGTPTGSSNLRPNMILGGVSSTIGTGTYSWQWSPGTLPSGNVATVNPVTNTTYTVTATDPLSACSSTATVAVTVNPLPATPTSAGSTQCGFGIPTAIVNGISGFARWYTVPTGGTPISGETMDHLVNTSINTTTTFYVADFDGSCESNRVAVLVTVINPDAITAMSSVGTGCTNQSIALSAMQTGSSNTYTYQWSATPVSGSGLPSPVSGQNINVSPTAVGTYIYTVTANDAGAGCSTISTVSVSINQSPSVTTTPVSASVCPNAPTQLLASGLNNMFSFNGTNQYIAVAQSPSLDLTSTAGNSITLEAWVNETAYPTTSPGDAGIISHYQSSSAASYFLRTNATSPYSGLGAGASTEITTANGTISLNTWTHVAAVFSYNPSASNDTVKIYINGVQVASGVTVIPHTNDSLRIASDFGGRYWNGKIDEVRIWNTALSAATLNSWMNQGVNPSHPNYANLVAYYDFNDPATTTVADKSGNGNTGYLRNGPVQQPSTAPISNVTFSWSPAGGLSDPTIANPVATVSTSTVYTVTVTSPNGCTATATSTLNVSSTAPAPGATPSTQCGVGVPGIQISGNNGIYRWYLVASGGTPIAGETLAQLVNYTISTTTTFYVAEFDGTCEGPRTAVTATVNPPDALTLIASPNPVCGNAPLTLTATQTGSTNTYNYSWTASPLAQSGITGSETGASVVVTPTAAGTYVYSVTGTDAGLGCVTVSTVSVTVQSPPFIASAAANPSVICLNSSTTLTGLTNDFAPGFVSIGSGTTSSIGGDEGNPYRSGNGAGNQIRTQLLVKASELIAAGMVPGNITSLAFTTTSSSTGTMINFSISMGHTTASALTTTFQTTPMTTVFTQASFTPVGAGLNTHVFTTPFSWNGTSNILINVCQTNSVIGTATVVTTNPGFIGNTHKSGSTTGCTDVTGSSTVAQRPIMRFGSQVGSTGPGAYTWQWSPGSIPAGNVAVVTPASSTIYTVTATDPGNGCTSTATVSVTVLTAVGMPVVQAAPATVCISGTVNLSVASPEAAFTYQWQQSATGVAGSWSNIGTGISMTTSTITTNTYFRVYSTCGTNSDTSVAVLVPVVNPSVSGNPSAMRCGPGPVTLTATGNGNFSWYANSSGGTALATNTATFTPIVGANTTYWIEASIGSCVSPSRTPATVTITNPPTASILATPGTTICNNQMLTLTASSSNDPNYTYYWSTDGVNPIATGNVFTANPSASTTYYLYAVDSSMGANYGCAYLVTTNITVNPAPSIPTITPSSSTICQSNGSVQLVASGGNASATLNFGTQANQNTAVTTAPGYPAPYTLFYGGQRMQMLITAAELTAAGFSNGSAFTNIQFPVVSLGSNWGNTVTALNSFQVSIGMTAATSISAFASGLTQVVAPANFTPAVGYANTHTFSTPFVWNGTSNLIVETTFSNNLLGGTNDLVAQYNSPTTFQSCIVYRADNVTPATAAAATTVTFSYNARPDFKLNATSNPVYSWSPGASLNMTTGNTVIASPTSNTTYTVSLTSGGCTSTNTATVAYSPITTPSISPSGSTTFCQGGGVSLDAGAGYTSYSWSDGIGVISTSQSVFVAPSATTTYTVTVTNSANCTATASSTITIQPLASPSIAPSGSTSFCQGSSVTLDAGSGYTSYSWSDGIGIVATSQTYLANSTATYTVTVTAANGCTATASVMVTVNPKPPVPVVTPSGPITLCSDGSDSPVTLSVDTTGTGGGGVVVWNDIFSTPALTYDVYYDDVNIVFGGNTFSFIATVTNTFNCSSISNSVSASIISCGGGGLSLNLRLFMQGYYIGSQSMQPVLLYQGVQGAIGTETDTILVELHQVGDPTVIEGSSSMLIATDGNGSCTFPSTPSGNYWIAVKHRNSIQTWSSSPIALPGSYDFSTSVTKAFGNNMVDVYGEGIWSIYTGDLNQDEYIDIFDFPDFDNDNQNFVSNMYVATDLNGDGYVDIFDFPVFDLNNQNFVFSIHP